jgi:hypothetical protein
MLRQRVFPLDRTGETGRAVDRAGGVPSLLPPWRAADAAAAAAASQRRLAASAYFVDTGSAAAWRTLPS